MNAMERMFGVGYDQKKLTLEFHTKRDNSADRRIRSFIDTLVNEYLFDQESFIRNLQEWMEETSMGNEANFWIYYKIVGMIDGKPAHRDTSRFEFEYVEVWHMNTQADLDRKVCTVKPIKAVQSVDEHPEIKPDDDDLGFDVQALHNAGYYIPRTLL